MMRIPGDRNEDSEIISLRSSDMKTINLFLSTALIALLALFASPAVAQSPTHDDPAADTPEVTQDTDADADADDEAFRQIVRAIDVIPDPKQLEERFPDASQRLIDIAEDPEITTYERWRATSLMGNFTEPHVKQSLLGLTTDDHERIRAMAYYVLGAAFLQEGDDELLDRLVDALDDDSDRVRARVVRSLGWTDHPDAVETLERILAKTDDDDIRGHAERALERHE